MPTINKPKKPKTGGEKHDKNKEIARIYNSTKWQKLRNGYLMQHPLCEECLKADVTKPATEVHHIRPISTGKDELQMKELAYNPDNLMSLCAFHHHLIHLNMKKKK